MVIAYLLSEGAAASDVASAVKAVVALRFAFQATSRQQGIGTCWILKEIPANAI